MAVSQALLGYGSKFLIGSDDVVPVYTEIQETRNITPPSYESDDVDVTHNSSPNRTRETIPGLSTPGACSFEMNFVPNSASELLLAGLRRSGEQRPCRIEFPTDPVVTWDFTASVKTIEISADTEDKMTATITMQVAGDYTAT